MNGSYAVNLAFWLLIRTDPEFACEAYRDMAKWLEAPKQLVFPPSEPAPQAHGVKVA